MIEIKKQVYPAYADRWGTRPEVTLWHVIVNGSSERAYPRIEEARRYVITRYGQELYDRDVGGRYEGFEPCGKTPEPGPDEPDA